MPIIARSPKLMLPSYVAPSSSAFATYITSLMPDYWWRMDEPPGATAFVDSVAGEVLPLSGTETLGAPSLLSGGTDTSVIWTSAGLATSGPGAKWALGAGDYSALFVAKWTATSVQIPFTIRDFSTGNQMATFHVNLGGTGSVAVEAQDGGVTYATSAGPYNDGAVHVIGMTQVVSSKTLRLYVDGDLKDTKTLSAARPSGATMNVTIAANVGLTLKFAGTQGHVVVFKKLLTDAENLAAANAALLGHT